MNPTPTGAIAPTPLVAAPLMTPTETADGVVGSVLESVGPGGVIGAAADHNAADSHADEDSPMPGPPGPVPTVVPAVPVTPIVSGKIYAASVTKSIHFAQRRTKYRSFSSFLLLQSPALQFCSLQLRLPAPTTWSRWKRRPPPPSWATTAITRDQPRQTTLPLHHRPPPSSTIVR